MNYTTKTTVDYPIINIEVFKDGKYCTSARCHIGQFEKWGNNCSFLDYIRVTKKYGYPNCIAEIEETVKPYLIRYKNEG